MGATACDRGVMEGSQAATWSYVCSIKSKKKMATFESGHAGLRLNERFSGKAAPRKGKGVFRDSAEVDHIRLDDAKPTSPDAYETRMRKQKLDAAWRRSNISFEDEGAIEEINASYRMRPASAGTAQTSTVWDTVTGQSPGGPGRRAAPRVRRGSLLQTEVFDDADTARRVFGHGAADRNKPPIVDFSDNDAMRRVYLMQLGSNRLDNSDYEGRAGRAVMMSRPSTGRRHFSNGRETATDVLNYEFGPAY